MSINISPDAKWILGGMAAGFLTLAGMTAGTFVMLDQRIDALAIDVATIKADMTAMRADVDALTAAHRITAEPVESVRPPGR